MLGPRFPQIVRPITTGWLAVALSVATLHAQTSRIEGVVRTSDGQPVVGARVVVVGTDLSGAAGDDGSYVIEGVPAGTHTLRVNAIGYQPLSVADQEVAEGSATRVDFALQLSSLHIEGVLVTGVREVESALSLGRVLEADTTTGNANDFNLVYTTYFDIGDFPQAQKWCDLGGERYPNDQRFTLCQLWMMTTIHGDPNIDEAWDLAAKVEALTPEALRPYFAHEARMVVGGVIARAGLADSANAVLTSARTDDSVDPSWDLLRMEAYMRLLGGQTETALDLLEQYRERRPDYSFYFEGDLHWFWWPIGEHPRFKVIRERD